MTGVSKLIAMIRRKLRLYRVHVALVALLVAACPLQGQETPAESDPKNALEQRLTLPAPVTQCCVGGGGRYMLLTLGSIGKLIIIDLQTQGIVHMIDVNDQTTRAAGMKKFVLLNSARMLIQRWDFEAFEPELTATVDLPKRPHLVAMGSASHGPVLVAGGNRYQSQYHLLDLKHLQTIDVQFESERQKRDFGVTGESQVRVSADGRVFTSQRGSSQYGDVLVLLGDEATTHSGRTSSRYFAPSPDGERIFTMKGIYSPEYLLLKGDPKAILGTVRVPATQTNLFLQFDLSEKRVGSKRELQQQVSMWLPDHDEPLASLTDLALTPRELRERYDRGRLGIDKRIVFSPHLNLIAVIPASNDCVVIRKCDLDEKLEQTNLPYLFVTSRSPNSVDAGQELSLRLVARAKHGTARFQLASGPSGFRVTADGRIKWTAPKKDSSPAIAIVKVSDEAGNSIFHTMRIDVRDPGKARRLAQSSSAAETNNKRPLRTWTDASGEFELTARYVGRDGDQVILEREDGGQSAIDYEQLSDEDQLIVRLLERFE